MRAEGFTGDIKRVDDFPVLKEIFDTDTGHKRHRPAPGGGVKVTDDTVWDDLSLALNEQALELQAPDRLLLIEFSRDNYVRAFKNFSSEVLKNSLIVYIDCPWDVCWERNARRAREEKGLDAHLVSREEMEKTYARDDHDELSQHVDAPILVVQNSEDSLEVLRENLRKVSEELLKLVRSAED